MAWPIYYLVVPSYALFFFALFKFFVAFVLVHAGLDLDPSGGRREKKVYICMRGKKRKMPWYLDK
jgi:hypothetical protein